MYIRNGIAYAGEEVPMLKVSGVRPLDNHKLWIRFNTGEAKIFDFTPLLRKYRTKACTFVNDVRQKSKNKSNEFSEMLLQAEGGAKPREEPAKAGRGQARVICNSFCFWLGDIQPRTAIGILLERRK